LCQGNIILKEVLSQRDLVSR